MTSYNFPGGLGDKMTTEPRLLTEEHRNGLYIASGSTHPELAARIAEAMHTELDPVYIKRFPDTEIYTRFEESVRQKHVVIIQTMAAVANLSANDSLMELYLLLDAARRGSSREITVVAPHLPYGRQDRKTKGRDPVSGALVIRQLEEAGANRLVTVDMHSAQLQGVFSGPFDHSVAEGLIGDTLAERVSDDPESFVIVSPDAGRAKASESYGNRLGVEVAYLSKKRDVDNSGSVTHVSVVPKAVRGKTCILIDDMIDTAGTLTSAAERLKDRGAKTVIAVATHGLFSDPAFERLDGPEVDEIIVTDTVPQDRAIKNLADKLTVLSVAPILADTIGTIAVGGSVSALFEGKNYS